MTADEAVIAEEPAVPVATTTATVVMIEATIAAMMTVVTTTVAVATIVVTATIDGMKTVGTAVTTTVDMSAATEAATTTTVDVSATLAERTATATPSAAVLAAAMIATDTTGRLSVILPAPGTLPAAALVATANLPLDLRLASRTQVRNITERGRHVFPLIHLGPDPAIR